MTDRTEPQVTALARALWSLSNLLTALRVTHVSVWQPARLITEQVVRVDVTGYPVERDELLAAMPETTPEQWRGDTGQTYREWRGTLLTMNVTVQETITGDDDDESEQATEPADVPEPLADWFGGDRGAVLPLGPGLSGPGGPMPEPQPQPEPTEQTAAGHSTSDLTARYAGVPGVVVVAGDEPGTTTRDLWASYARGKCLDELGGRTYATVADATAAIETWPGRDMLELVDVERCAHELATTAQPAQPEPPRRRLRFLPGRRSVGAH